MPRVLRLAACQVGAVNIDDPRPKTLARLIKLLEDAAAQGAQIALFPEITFTTFFPRHLIKEDELSHWFEHGDITTSPDTSALFDKARSLGVDIAVGFAEACNGTDRLARDGGECYNTCIYYHAKSGSVLSKYRKVHLPGDFEPFPEPDAVNQLEKRYFKPGNLGFEAFRVPDFEGQPILGMMICNDRRWAEAWRCLGLQGVEVVLCGYNTAGWAPEMWGSSKDQSAEEAEKMAVFQHELSMQSHSYTNSCFSVSAARCGYDDEKYLLIAGSCITTPQGRIVAKAKTMGDEVVIADCDLDECKPGKARTFDFARHRRVEHYGRLTSQTGVIEPPLIQDNSTIPNGCSEKHVTWKGMEKKKNYRILLCNPNATKPMTDKCIAMVKPTLPPDVEVHGFTSPKPAPSAIEGHFDNIMSGAEAARAILPIAHEYDAFLVACYSDHSLTKMLREELTQPVVGIMEASLQAGRTLGGRFGIIATSRRSKYTLEDSVRAMGLAGFCAGVQSCDLGVLELETRPEQEIQAIMCEAASKLVDEGADTLTLGCAGMSKMREAVKATVGEDVQVIDGVLAGVHHLIGLLRMGVRTAKKGVYTSSAVNRDARKQQYV